METFVSQFKKTAKENCASLVNFRQLGGASKTLVSLTYCFCVKKIFTAYVVD